MKWTKTSWTYSEGTACSSLKMWFLKTEWTFTVSPRSLVRFYIALYIRKICKYTVCPKSLDPIFLADYIELTNTSWTYSIISLNWPRVNLSVKLLFYWVCPWLCIECASVPTSEPLYSPDNGICMSWLWLKNRCARVIIRSVQGLCLDRQHRRKFISTHTQRVLSYHLI